MFVGVLRITLHLPGNSSLKGKRRVVRSIVERARTRFNAAVAEVGKNDDRRRAEIGACVIGNEAGHVDAMIQKIVGFVEGSGLAPVSGIQTELIPLGGELGISSVVEADGDEGLLDSGVIGYDDAWEEDER